MTQAAKPQCQYPHRYDAVGEIHTGCQPSSKNILPTIPAQSVSAIVFSLLCDLLEAVNRYIDGTMRQRDSNGLRIFYAIKAYEYDCQPKLLHTHSFERFYMDGPHFAYTHTYHISLVKLETAVNGLC